MIDYQLFSDHDLLQMAKDELRKKVRLEAEAEACERTSLALQTELTHRALARKKIGLNSIVTVHFKDWCRDFRFEGVNDSHWSGTPRLRLRPFTARGKPCKKILSYEPSIISLMTRKDKPNG